MPHAEAGDITVMGALDLDIVVFLAQRALRLGGAG